MTDREIILNRADSAVLSRDYFIAARLYKSLLKKTPDDKSLIFKLGSMYTKSGNDLEALPYYQKVIENEPDNFNALLSLGGIYRRIKQYDKSIEVLQKALKTGKDDPQINYNLGFTYKFMNEYDKAVECFRSVIEENPNDVLAYNHLGVIYALRKDYENAISTYQRGLKVDSNHPILHLNLAKSFEALHQDQNAINSYKSALRARPGWQEAIESFSALLLRTQHRKTAERLVRQSLDLNPRDPKMNVLLGDCLASQSDYKHALEAYKAASESDPNSEEALSGIAMMNDQMGIRGNSMEIMQNLETKKPEDTKISKEYAQILLSNNHLESALKRINHVLKKAPKDLQALNLLGQYYLCNENDNKAQETYQKIESINPSYVDHLRDAASRCKQLGNVSKAQRYIDKYLEEKPEDPSGLIIKSILSELTESTEDALANYHKVLKFDQHNALALEAVKRLGQKINDHVAQKKVENIESHDEVFLDDVPEVSMDIDESQFENSDNSTNENEIPSDEFDMDAWGNEHPLALKDEALEFAKDEDFDFDTNKPTSLDDLIGNDSPIDDEPVAKKASSYDNIPNELQMESLGDDDLLGNFDEPKVHSLPKPPEPKPQEPKFPETPVPQAELSEEAQEKLNEAQKNAAAEAIKAAEEAQKAAQAAADALSAAEESALAAEQAGDTIDEMRQKAEDLTQSLANQMEALNKSEPEEEVLEEPVQDPLEEDDFPDFPVEQSEEDYDNFDGTENQEEEPQVVEEPEESVEEEPQVAEEPVEDEEETVQGDQVDEINSLLEKTVAMVPAVVNILRDTHRAEKNIDLLKLFQRLHSLSECLPPEKKIVFMESKDRIQLDYVIAKLEGRPGLLATAQALRKANLISEGTESEIKEIPLSGQPLTSAVLDMMTEMSSGLTDQTLTNALNSICDKIKDRISLLNSN